MLKELIGGIWNKLLFYFRLLFGLFRVLRFFSGARRLKSGGAAGQMHELLEKDDAAGRRKLLEELLGHNKTLGKEVQALRQRLRWFALLASVALLFALAALLVMFFGAAS